MKSDSLTEQGVQPVAKPETQSVAQPVWHRERHQEQDCESHRVKDRKFKCVFESRFEGRSEYGFACVCTQSENAVSWL